MCISLPIEIARQCPLERELRQCSERDVGILIDTVTRYKGRLAVVRIGGREAVRCATRSRMGRCWPLARAQTRAQICAWGTNSKIKAVLDHKCS